MRAERRRAWLSANVPRRTASGTTTPKCESTDATCPHRSGAAVAQRLWRVAAPHNSVRNQTKPNQAGAAEAGGLAGRRAWSSACRNFVVSTVHPPSIPAERMDAHALPLVGADGVSADRVSRRARPSLTAVSMPSDARCSVVHKRHALRRSRHESESTSVRRCAAHNGASIRPPMGSGFRLPRPYLR